MEYKLANHPQNINFDSTFLDQQYTDFHKRFIANQDAEIKKALIKNGFEIYDLEFLKNNFQFIEIAGDNFRHFYFHVGMEDEKRIISFQKTPEITYENDCNKITASIKFY